MVGRMCGNRIRTLATPLGKVKNDCLKIFMISPVQMFGLPNSPGLNAMDYFVWGAVEKDTNHCASNTKVQLMDKIKLVF